MTTNLLKVRTKIRTFGQKPEPSDKCRTFGELPNLRKWPNNCQFRRRIFVRTFCRTFVRTIRPNVGFVWPLHHMILGELKGLNCRDEMSSEFLVRCRPRLTCEDARLQQGFSFLGDRDGFTQLKLTVASSAVAHFTCSF